jgi:uncharacterized membrane protein YhhN
MEKMVGWRLRASIVCLIIGVAMAFAHIVITTTAVGSIASIITKPLLPLACGIACVCIANGIQRWIICIAFIAYGAGDVLLELQWTWSEIAGVIAFGVGHVLIAIATFIHKHESILKKNGMVLTSLIIALVVAFTLYGISFGCNTTNLMRLAKLGYLLVLFGMILCVADTSYWTPSLVLLAGTILLVVSDGLAFSRSLCGFPQRLIAYNIVEMVVYYAAILCIGCGATYTPQW